MFYDELTYKYPQPDRQSKPSALKRIMIILVFRCQCLYLCTSLCILPLFILKPFGMDSQM